VLMEIPSRQRTPMPLVPEVKSVEEETLGTTTATVIALVGNSYCLVARGFHIVAGAIYSDFEECTLLHPKHADVQMCFVTKFLASAAFETVTILAGMGAIRSFVLRLQVLRRLWQVQKRST
jgi:hypothetical protein